MNGKRETIIILAYFIRKMLFNFVIKKKKIIIIYNEGCMRKINAFLLKN